MQNAHPRLSTLFVMNRVFRVVGNPGAAVQATLTAGQSIRVAYGAVAVSQAALEIERGHYASLAGPADLVLSPPHAPSIFELTQKWTVNPQHLVAWNAKFENNTMEGPGEMVMSGRGGICQVDVGDGEQLVIEADKLVAHTGPEGTTVFRESRIDVAKAWMSWVWNGIKGATRWTGQKSREIASWVSWLISKLGPPKKAEDAVQPPSKTPEETLKPRFELPKGVDDALVKMQEYQAKASAGIFKYTHPPKLLFHGPCSVLIIGSK